MIVGIIKPKGPTSHDMIYQVRRITGVKRVGHAGTLDPAAEGVLVIAIERESTKLLSTIVGQEKEYQATVRLGAMSSTDDSEGEIVENHIDTPITIKDITAIVKQFIGTIQQIPPAFSAIKLGGKKAYELARKGKVVKMEPREVVIYDIKVLSYTWPDLVIAVRCGKGVYIRSLARDIGKALGVGGYMSALTRTRVGDFRLDTSYTIEAFAEKWHETHPSTNQRLSD